jgi:hypothetical protein
MPERGRPRAKWPPRTARLEPFDHLVRDAPPPWPLIRDACADSPSAAGIG